MFDGANHEARRRGVLEEPATNPSVATNDRTADGAEVKGVKKSKLDAEKELGEVSVP